MHRPHVFVRRALALLLITAAVAGCKEKITVYNVPDFWDPSLQAIAVVPFKSPMDGGRSGAAIAADLARALQANGTYKVYNRSDLATLLNEQDLQMALSSDPAQAAAGVRKLGKVQAILVGDVSQYTANTDRQAKRDPVYGYNPNTGALYVSGYRNYTFFHHSATVAASATLIRVSDGGSIHSTGPVSWNQWSKGENPPYKADQCLNISRQNVVFGMLKQLAITQQEIEIKPDEALRTATHFNDYDNKWVYSEHFTASQDTMYVVIQLPDACDRNPFTIKIARPDQGKVIEQREFRWSKQEAARGMSFEFSPSQLAQLGGGPGKYSIRFYTGPEPVMDHEFTISP